MRVDTPSTSDRLSWIACPKLFAHFMMGAGGSSSSLSDIAPPEPADMTRDEELRSPLRACGGERPAARRSQSAATRR